MYFMLLILIAEISFFQKLKTSSISFMFFFFTISKPTYLKKWELINFFPSSSLFLHITLYSIPSSSLMEINLSLMSVGGELYTLFDTINTANCVSSEKYETDVLVWLIPSTFPLHVLQI